MDVHRAHSPLRQDLHEDPACELAPEGGQGGKDDPHALDSFPILGDHGGSVAAKFGVRWTPPPYLREVQTALEADLTQFTGEGSWTLPMLARYLIAQDGVIAYAEVNADYTRRPEPSAIFPVLEQLGRQLVA